MYYCMLVIHFIVFGRLLLFFIILVVFLRL